MKVILAIIMASAKADEQRRVHRHEHEDDGVPERAPEDVVPGQPGILVEHLGGHEGRCHIGPEQVERRE